MKKSDPFDYNGTSKVLKVLVLSKAIDESDYLLLPPKEFLELEVVPVLLLLRTGLLA